MRQGSSDLSGSQSDLACLCVCARAQLGLREFNNIETDSAIERKGRNIKFIVAQIDDKDIKDEENDYEILDEEVFCVLLGLNENMGFS
jgi:hypothetical protein